MVADREAVAPVVERVEWEWFEEIIDKFKFELESESISECCAEASVLKA